MSRKSTPILHPKRNHSILERLTLFLLYSNTPPTPLFTLTRCSSPLLTPLKISITVLLPTCHRYWRPSVPRYTSFSPSKLREILLYIFLQRVTGWKSNSSANIILCDSSRDKNSFTMTSNIVNYVLIYNWTWNSTTDDHADSYVDVGGIPLPTAHSWDKPQ